MEMVLFETSLIYIPTPGGIFIFPRGSYIKNYSFCGIYVYVYIDINVYIDIYLGIVVLYNGDGRKKLSV